MMINRMIEKQKGKNEPRWDKFTEKNFFLNKCQNTRAVWHSFCLYIKMYNREILN